MYRELAILYLLLFLPYAMKVKEIQKYHRCKKFSI